MIWWLGAAMGYCRGTRPKTMAMESTSARLTLQGEIARKPSPLVAAAASEANRQAACCTTAGRGDCIHLDAQRRGRQARDEGAR